MNRTEILFSLNLAASRLAWPRFEGAVRRNTLAAFLYRNVDFHVGGRSVWQPILHNGKYGGREWPWRRVRMQTDFATVKGTIVPARRYRTQERRLKERLSALIRLFVWRKVRDVVFSECGLVAAATGKYSLSAGDIVCEVTRIQCQPTANCFLDHLADIGNCWHRRSAGRLAAVMSRSAYGLIQEDLLFGGCRYADRVFHGIELMLGPPGMPENSIIVLPQSSVNVFSWARRDGEPPLIASVSMDIVRL